MKESMNACERFAAVIRGETPDRLPAIEWAPWWDKTITRWRGEGLPDTAQTVEEIQGYFGLDRCCQTLLSWMTAETPLPPGHGLGIIKDEEDYERLLPTMYPEPRLPGEYIDWLKKTRERGDTLHFFTLDGFFWQPRTLLGIEPHLYSFYDQPDLYKRICADNAAWVKRVAEYIGNTFRFDFMSFAEDMSYNNGPMISEEQFDEFLLPYYKQVFPLFQAMGTPVFVDSDGDITRAVDWYARAGANGMFPLERQAGVDVSLYIRKQPQMTFLGHFDKMCMKFGEEAMRAEFERLLPSARQGKFIFSCDHQTPPDVSIENYRIYVRLLKEYAVKAAQKG
ncbi:MAG TPA: hypothetical protein H9729_01090 [Candidatus Borkfalkia excrementigallinarum]|uniref:Uroporphyrinogen decarboxylase (URO-D) domain-containing protein n=1 Tax=Candidatus Borkfalkia excrementigallinarum TaxID=2838506 RepID=A0A9D1ZV65_9FIRM|nr:hypothetical protein [Candidatus Borkfalkia excrementigallinarum]